MKVSEIMTTNVKTVQPDTTISEVVSIMCLDRLSGLPVTLEDELVGFIAEQDVLRELFPSLDQIMNHSNAINYQDLLVEYKYVISGIASSIMTRNPISVTPGMPVLKASAIIFRRKFRRIPVTEGNNLIGMLSVGDIHRAIYHQNITTALNVVSG